MRYVDSNSVAENPGNASISNRKLKEISKLLNLNFFDKLYLKAQKKRIGEFIKFGDIQPAVVYSVSPLLIAAYSDEMDAVVMLEFPSELVNQYNLSVGTRLVTSNVYVYKDSNEIASDIFIGENYLEQYSDFEPILDLFLSEDETYLEQKTLIFDEKVWDNVIKKAEDYVKKHPGLNRNGFYYLLLK